MPRKKKTEEENSVEDIAKSQDEVVEEEAEEREESQKSIIMLPSLMDMLGGGGGRDKKIRTIGLIGDVTEEKASDVIYGLLTLRETGIRQELEDPNDPNSEIIETCEPMEMIISTYGGSAMDMFGIHDMMRNVREDCEIHTVGIGKVMSAGVLILASGTKGKRRIGKNCRVMIHSVVGGTHGAMHNLENEMDEIRWIQERYIETLVRESDMTKAMVRKMLNRKVNIYLTAEQAVEYGIADEVF
jgi:ATP-dependent Clp endopeptidase proteolytic subunit ClpP